MAYAPTLTTTVTCGNCGASAPLRFTHLSTPHRDRLTVTVRIQPDRDDLAWLHVFTDAHTGPFT